MAGVAEAVEVDGAAEVEAVELDGAAEVEGSATETDRIMNEMVIDLLARTFEHSRLVWRLRPEALRGLPAPERQQLARRPVKSLHLLADSAPGIWHRLEGPNFGLF